MDVCINNNKAKSYHQRLCSQLFAKKKVDYQLFNVPCRPVQKNEDDADGLSPLSEKTRMSIVYECHSKGSIFSLVIFKVLFRSGA